MEGKNLLEMDSVAEVTVGEMAFMDDAAGTLNVGTRTAGKISGHVQSHGKRRANLQGQRAAHEEARTGDVRGFRGKFGLC